MLGAPLLTSTHPRDGAILTPSGNHLLLMTRVSKAVHLMGQHRVWIWDWFCVSALSLHFLLADKAAAAAADPNAAWAAYYSHYYQQPPGPVPGPAPAPAAPPAQGEPPQPPPAGQSDYTKAWEEYYKKIGECVGHDMGSSQPEGQKRSVVSSYLAACLLQVSSPSSLELPHNKTTRRPGRSTTRSRVSYTKKK